MPTYDVQRLEPFAPGPDLTALQPLIDVDPTVQPAAVDVSGGLSYDTTDGIVHCAMDQALDAGQVTALDAVVMGVP